MQQTATITSKRQLTIPSEIFRRLGLKKGHKVIVSVEGSGLKITPALDLIEKLAGSVETPGNYKNISFNNIIKKAKKDYFARNKLVYFARNKLVYFRAKRA